VIFYQQRLFSAISLVCGSFPSSKYGNTRVVCGVL
jgi:hypothetical protein